MNQRSAAVAVVDVSRKQKVTGSVAVAGAFRVHGVVAVADDIYADLGHKQGRNGKEKKEEEKVFHKRTLRRIRQYCNYEDIS